MDNSMTYTKGLYTARAEARHTKQGQYRGYVVLIRDEGDTPEETLYEVEATSPNEPEALAEAKALAHRILGQLES